MSKSMSRWCTVATWGAGGILASAVPTLLAEAAPLARRRMLHNARLVTLLLVLQWVAGRLRKRGHPRLASAMEKLVSDEWRIRAVPLVGVLALGIASARNGGFLRNRHVGEGVAEVVMSHVVMYASVPTFANAVLELGEGREVDVAALLAIIVGVLRGQIAAAVVILLMLTGGEALEHYALSRAGRSVHALLQAAPTTGFRIVEGGGEGGETVPVEAIRVGDRLLVASGGVIPVDAVIEPGSGGSIDDSPVTGETVPRHRSDGDTVFSGAVYLGEGTLYIRATAVAAESTFQQIQLHLSSGVASDAGMERVSIQCASTFTPFALWMATAALLRGGWDRALGVLMAATPCPLAIGVPVAFLAGLSVAARHGMVVKTRDALQLSGEATTVVFDKTGTLTDGTPTVSNVVVLGSIPHDTMLWLVASVEQYSNHPLARAVVSHCRHTLGDPDPHWRVTDRGDCIGRAMRGAVYAGGIEYQVVIGGWEYLIETGISGMDVEVDVSYGGMVVGVAIDGVLCGAIHFQDQLRAEATRVVRQLRGMGIKRLLMFTGDRSQHAQRVAEELGLEHHVCLPHEKASRVTKLQEGGDTVLMVGDGVNDAAALFEAHVGVSLGTSELASESANVVLVGSGDASGAMAGKSLLQVVDLIKLGRAVNTIAASSVNGGMVCSICQMFVATVGLLSPFTNACMQEAVDLSAILNSLRVLRVRLDD